MNKIINDLMDNKWWQEFAVVAFSFTIYTLKNDWMFISSLGSIMLGVLFYVILYVHAQFNRFIFLPILFKKHKPIIYILLTIIGIFIFSVLLNKLMTLSMFSQCQLYQNSHQRSFSFQFASVSGTLVCILSPIIVFKFYRIYKQQTDKIILYNQMQVNSLRTQLNPHFLFNTFNTLYGISLQFPQRTSDLIMKVSQLMRYQTESTHKEFVCLENELDFINSYVQLEKERVANRCDISYFSEIDKESTYKISPMLLITFIENAFKHGTCAIEKCYVHINISVKNGLLHLIVVNSVPKESKVVSTNIGLKNTIARLKLTYGEDYSLNITNDPKTYNVDLKIQLKMGKNEGN
ncbi:histidine kinase [Cyclobacterium sp. 1_MG-2023]|uniref:sensor histidine kinase n=1 Tax=Cyclobacterium sp. 1_MG-2023 TaxID=3062681 RepID=UPI0026E3A0EA|nr:histidine kinase [Cyclobacterium sp. 1_MG-2023]MDO6436220.1 histidine kinase [Cyclobacterium sp. 1_MG-2023]